MAEGVPSIIAVVTLSRRTARKAQNNGDVRERLSIASQPAKTIIGGSRNRHCGMVRVRGRRSQEYHGGAVERVAVSVCNALITTM
jgi:hypothetical protein